MDQCTCKVRMEHWKNVIMQCQNRELGQSVKIDLAFARSTNAVCSSQRTPSGG